MKLKNYLLLTTLFFFGCNTIFAQLVRPFTPRLTGGSIEVKGDIELIGNTIITPVGQALPFNGAGNNNNFVVQYLDVDSNPTTVNSSSADLLINQTCKKIVYAGLYWSAFYPNATNTDTSLFYDNTNRRDDWNQVKFSAKGAPYVTLTADENPDPVGDEDNILAQVKYNNNNTETVYACYKNITSILQGLADADGTYTVADLRATTGNRRGGCAGGWTMVVIYESPQLPSKNIAVFDGFGFVNVDPAPAQLLNLNIPVSGFKTVPSPLTVNAKIGIGALDGDFSSTGDGLSFKSGPLASPGVFTNITDVLNPNPIITPPPGINFFNSTISRFGSQVTNRNPASTNTIGLDIDHVILNNPANSVLPNGATEGTLKISTTGDGYGVFLSTFAVDILAPKIVLSKKVVNTSGADITGQTVGRSAFLKYIIGFENKGSDKGKDVTITDYLPKNIKFNYPGDISPLPTGVTVQSYDPLDPLGRKIVFKVTDDLVDLLNDQERFIEFKVQILTECKDFDDACSNLIENTAYTRYTGVENKDIFDDSSQPPTAGCVFGLKATNFLANIDGCTFEKSYELCGANVDISAANGYQNYVWTLPGGGTATGQIITVKAPGTYLVHGDPKAPCIKSIDETVTVKLFNNAVTTNPISVYAANIKPDGSDRGVITKCPGGTQKDLPQLFLCGANDKRLLEITNASVIAAEWFRLDGTAACITKAENNGAPILCANEDLGCAWTSLIKAKSYEANAKGFYKVKLNYAGGCFNEFYFNVFKNPLNPTATSKNIFCTTPGSMTVGGVPLDGTYEFSFTTTGSPGTWVSSPTTPNPEVFTTTTPGLYTAYIRLKSPTGGCVFTVSKQIDPSNFKIKTELTQPTCTKPLGDIKVTAENGNPLKDYTYILTKTGVPGSTVQGPIAVSNYTFQNQGAGTYLVRVTTADGCDLSQTVILNPIVKLIPTATLTIALTCKPGEITVNPNGGTGPYSYFVNINGVIATTFQTDPKIVIPLGSEGKSYVIRVVDINNCEANTPPIVIPANPKPTYDFTTKPVKCYTDKNGEIHFTSIVNPSNYTLQYSINNGGTYQNSPDFLGLVAGSFYQLVIKYSFPATGTTTETTCIDTAKPATIAGPVFALTASAGVAELAGCGVAPNPTNFGKVRITNAQGGIPPYTYSFDEGVTYGVSNEAYVAPNPTGYTLYVKDNIGCIFPIPGIKLNPPPTPPTIDVTPPTSICDGTATVTATVTSPPSTNYSFKYFLDANPENTGPTPNVFKNVSSSPPNHKVCVEYLLTSVPTYSNLLFEDFGQGGYTTTPGINPAYCFEDEITPHPSTWPKACGGINDYQINDGKYAVASSIKTTFGVWIVNPKDHTVPSDPLGRFLCVNVGGTAGVGGVLYSKAIKDVIPFQDVQVSIWAENLIRNGINAGDPDLTIQLWKDYGLPTAVQVGVSVNTGNIPKSEKWENYILPPINPGNNNDLTFLIRSNSTVINGNDVLIDDINVYQIPKSCITKACFDFIVPTNKAFTAAVTNITSVKCNGESNGGFTITAQNYASTGYFYKIDGAVTWTGPTTVSPLVLDNLGAGSHTVLVSYDKGVSAACTNTFRPTIPDRVALVTDATATVATCLTGGVVTATVNGVSAGYEFQLKNNSTGALIPATTPFFQSSGTFINVAPGFYTVVGRDSNLCVDNKDTALEVKAAGTFIASLAPATNFCYDAINKATLVVTTDKPLATYTYSLDGKPSQNSPTFTGVGVGIHEIIVTDSNTGCTSKVSGIEIKPEVKATPVIKQLDCSASPDATITVNITDGYPGYTYKVKKGAGTYGTANTVTGTQFSITVLATNADLYTFEITDSKGCKTYTDATINALTQPTLTATPTNPKCFGDTNGSVQLNPAGGSGGYNSYVITAPASATVNVTGATTGLFTGLSANILYTFQVKDSKGCSGTTTATLTQPTQLAISATATAFKCDVLTNVKQTATITIAIPTTGTGPYTYSFDNVAYSATRTLTINDTGADQTITYYVKDANNCPTSKTIVVSKLNPVTKGTIAGSTITCLAGATTGTITLVPTVGTGVATITYVITAPASAIGNVTGASSGIFTGLAPDFYTFKVTDANGCYYIDSFDLKPVAPVTAGVSSFTNATCNGASDGKIVFTVGGNPGAFTYVLKNNAGATIPIGQSTVAGTAITYTGLPQDLKYTLTVTNPATGCTATPSQIITEPTKLVFAVPTATKLTCITPSISTITVVAPTTGTPTYTYAAVVTGAAAPLAGAYAATNPFTVNTTTGVNLVWDVYVKDANGCTTKQTVTIVQDALPVITTPPAPVCFTGASFPITFSGTGIAPLTYGINGSYQALPYSVTAPGTYVLTIKDGNGCVSAPVNYVVNDQLKLVATLDNDQTCSLPGNAKISLNATGGAPTYTYEYSTNGGGTYSPMVPSNSTTLTVPITALASINYVFRVTDSKLPSGCTAISNVITVTRPLPVGASYTDIKPTCNTSTDGSIKINASGGEPPYLYSNDAGLTFTTKTLYGSLIGGTYNYIVKDIKGCTFPLQVILTAPAPLNVSVVKTGIVCNLNTPGKFDVTLISGGVGLLTYTLYDYNTNAIAIDPLTSLPQTITTGATTHTFNNLTFGDYYIKVVDANKCEYISPKDRIETIPNLTLGGLVDNNSCLLGVDYTVKVTNSTNSPYTFSIFGQPLTTFVAALGIDTHQFLGLNHNTKYIFEVLDKNGCPNYFEDTTPPPPSSINLTGVTPTNIKCKGDNNGQLAFTVQNFDPTVTTLNYVVLDYLTNLPIVPAKTGPVSGPAGGPASGLVTGLPSGRYYIKVTESTGTQCSANSEFSIIEPSQNLDAKITSEVNANCNNGAQVTVAATGGTQPYAYAFVQDGALVNPGDYGVDNFKELLPNTVLNWDIYVKDANNCTPIKIDKLFIKDPDPIITPLIPQCYTGTPITVPVTANVFVGSSTTYAIGTGVPGVAVAGAYSTNANVVFSGPGSYTIFVKDDNGCIATAPYVIRDEIKLNLKINKILTCTAATIDGVITGGTGSGTYSYTVQVGAGLPTGPFPVTGTTFTYNTAATADTYTFVIKDGSTAPACSGTNFIIVNPENPALFTTPKVDVDCKGSSTGSITVSVTSGEGPYEYKLDRTNPVLPVISRPYQSPNIFNLLPQGTYTVTVRDKYSCEYPSSPITIGEPALALALDTPTKIGLSCGLGNVPQAATVTLNVTAGTGTAPYEYSFNGGSYSSVNTLPVNDTGATQTINYIVKDKNGCTIPSSVIINPLDPPKIVSVVPSPIFCLPLASQTSTATITITNGVGPTYTYTILSGPTINLPTATSATGATFTGLTAGDYVFEVKDANGCTDKKAITIAPVKNIDLQILSQSDVKCNGANDGTGKLTVSGFGTTYSYTVNGAPTGTNVNSPTIDLGVALAPNSYIVLVTDDVTGCTATQTITIAQPTPVTLALDPTVGANVNANCNVGAKVTVIASGGTPGYLYSFVQDNQPAGPFTASTSAILDPAFVWDAWVQDANLCQFKLDLVIIKDPLPIISATPNQCITATGYTIKVDVLSGIGAPYEYSIGNGFVSDPLLYHTFTVNTDGNYTATVRDKNGCVSLPVTVTILPALDLKIDSFTLPDCTTIPANGQVTLLASGGSGVLANYAYRVDGGSFGPSPNFINLAVGPHVFEVQDNGSPDKCIKEVKITFDPATPVKGLVAKPFDVSCNGSTDGRIEATIDPSTATVNFDTPYTYAIAPIPTNPGYVAPPAGVGTFTNLPPNTYTVTVTSARGCPAFLPNIIVKEPAPIIVTPVVTQYGCTKENITNFAKITVTNVVGGNVSLNYTYKFIKKGATIAQDVVVYEGKTPEYTETDLLGGDYIINVYDDKNCPGTITAKIDKFIDLDIITVDVTSPITCENKESIAVTVKSKDGTLLTSPTANLEYKVVDKDPTTGVEGVNYNPPANSTGVFSDPVSGLGIGQYKVTVTNKTTNCFVETIHKVSDPNTFELVASAITNLKCFGDADGSVKITLVDKQLVPTDDAGPFTYNLTSNNPLFVTRTNVASTGVTADIINLIRGIYTIKAKLNSGTECPVETTFTIEGPPEKLVIDASIGVVTCAPGADGVISASATGGWAGGYEYKLDGTATVAYSANGEFKGLSAGTYTVTVKDVSGCEDFKLIELDPPTPIAVIAIADKSIVNCTGEKTATITATVTTGNGGYLYTLNNTSVTPPTTDGPYPSGVFQTLGKGTYTVTVTDKLGCDKTSNPVIIGEPTKVEAELTLDKGATCETDGRVRLIAKGGQSPYTYSADGSGYSTTTFTTDIVINAPESTIPYHYYVKDALGCISDLSNDVPVLKPEELILKIDDSNAKILCKGSFTGVIVATATGGLGNYVYTLTDANGVDLNPQPGLQPSVGRFTELGIGDYYVKVVSGDCVEKSPVIPIREPDSAITAIAIPTNITCNGNNDGKIEVKILTLGTGIITYAITRQDKAPPFRADQFFEKGVFTGLKVGLYDLIAQDENGCVFPMLGIPITEPEPLVVDLVAGTVVQEKCYGDKNAAFSINVTGGTLPYTVILDQDPKTKIIGTLTQTQFDFVNIAGGEHVVSIEDANLCPTEFRELLDVAIDIAPEVTIDYGCPTVAEPLLNTVIVTVNPALNAGDVTYMLDGIPYAAGNVYVSNGGIFQNVTVGKHTVLVKHKDGCEQLAKDAITKEEFFIIEQIDPISVLLTQGGLNEIVATVTGGSGGNHFYFNGEDNGSNNKYIYYRSGDYEVIVIDDHGCEARDKKPFVFIDIEVPEIFTPNGDGNNDGWRPNKTENYPDLIYYVFDRYGRKLGTFRQPESWDGKYDGKELPTGDYWYALKLRNVKDEREFVGHFMLYR